jgi:hypothetical protein
MTTKKLSISPVALSKTDASVLKVSLGILKDMNALFEVLSEDDISGSVVLLDADSDAGKGLYAELSGKRGQMLIVLTEQTLNDTRNLVLKKPLRVQTLKDVLFDLHQQLSAPAAAGLSLNKAPPPAVSAAPVSSAPFAADQNLFFTLLKIQRAQQRAQIFYPPFSPLYADGKDGIVATSASRATLRKMVSQPCDKLKTLNLSDADFDILARGQLIMHFSHVLWSAALFGSQAQLIDDLSVDQPLRLKAWPNFSRLDFDQPHMALSSLMASQPMTIQQIQAKTKLDVSIIIGFVNASAVTDILDASAPKAAPVAPPPAAAPHNDAKRGLFAKIAKRLNIDQQK